MIFNHQWPQMPASNGEPVSEWQPVRRVVRMTLNLAAPSLWIVLFSVVFRNPGRGVVDVLVEATLYLWTAYWLVSSVAWPLMRRRRRRRLSRR